MAAVIALRPAAQPRNPGPRRSAAPVVRLAPPAHEEARTCTLHVIASMLDYLDREGGGHPERHQVEAILRETQKRLRRVGAERVIAAALARKLKGDE